MKKTYFPPFLKASNTEFEDIIMVSFIDDTLDIFDVDVNEEL